MGGLGVVLCACGCGDPAPLATKARAERGQRRGDPLRFIRFHHLRVMVHVPSVVNYPTTSLPDGRVMKTHRLRAERALGKSLPPGAVVHHADGSKRADAPLVICQDRQYHELLHVRTRVVQAGGNPNTDKICAHCQIVKPRTAFKASQHTTDQLHETCAACVSAMSHARYIRRRTVQRPRVW